MTFAESERASALGRARLESTQVSSSFEGGGRDAAPAGEPSVLARVRARFRESVWAPVAVKVLGVGLGMLALSGIRAVSIAASGQGIAFPGADAKLHKDISGVWLAGSLAAPPTASAAPRQAGPHEKTPPAPPAGTGARRG